MGNPIDQLISKFTTKHGMSEPTVRIVSDLALRLMDQHPDDDDDEARRQRLRDAVQAAYERGEAWACEWMETRP